MAADEQPVDEKEVMQICLRAICHPATADNTYAWAFLHFHGLTREVMGLVVDLGKWQGDAPVFDRAPDYDSTMWRMMTGQVDLVAFDERVARLEAEDAAQSGPPPTTA